MKKKGLIIFNKTFGLAADPSAYADYGPFMPGFVTVPYNNLAALEEQLKVSESMPSRTDKKENQIFLLYKEIQNGTVAKL
jgi:hypothetical protein